MAPGAPQLFAGEQGAPPKSQASSAGGVLPAAPYSAVRESGTNAGARSPGSLYKVPAPVVLPGVSSSGGSRAVPSPKMENGSSRGMSPRGAVTRVPSLSGRAAAGAPSPKAVSVAPPSPIFAPAARARMIGDSAPSSPTGAKRSVPATAAAAAAGRGASSPAAGRTGSRIPSAPAAKTAASPAARAPTGGIFKEGTSGAGSAAGSSRADSSDKTAGGMMTKKK
jgi:hypothetical protein